MQYASALPSDFQIPKSAFWMRKDLEKNPFQLVAIDRGGIVMDCGAYIGSFTSAAIEQGAKSAVCYEASPKNAAMLRSNMKRYQCVTVVEAALISGNASSIDLMMSGFSGAHSILPRANHPKIIHVPAINFQSEIRAIRPTVIKLDVEGAEYDLLASLIRGDLSSVKCISIEFHPIENRDDRIARVRAFLISEGFQIISDRRRAFIGLRIGAT